MGAAALEAGPGVADDVLDALVRRLLAAVRATDAWPSAVAGGGPWLLRRAQAVLRRVWAAAMRADAPADALPLPLQWLVLATRAPAAALWDPVWADVDGTWRPLHAALGRAVAGPGKTVGAVALVALAAAAVNQATAADAAAAAAVAVLAVPAAVRRLQSAAQLRASPRWPGVLAALAAPAAQPWARLAPAGTDAALALLANVADLGLPAGHDGNAPAVVAAWLRLVCHAAVPRAAEPDDDAPTASQSFHPLYQWRRDPPRSLAADDAAAQLTTVVQQVAALWRPATVAALFAPDAPLPRPAVAELYLAVLDAFPAVERDVRNALAFRPGLVPALWAALVPATPSGKPDTSLFHLKLDAFMADPRLPLLRLYSVLVIHLYQ